ncbi:MAG TPA: serine hydrolase domain-containing protein [Polyangiaceae bacterium]|nr:serine hydrolase domain-containing protein [Polyangiaceae bacterium]
MKRLNSAWVALRALSLAAVASGCGDSASGGATPTAEAATAGSAAAPADGSGTANALPTGQSPGSTSESPASAGTTPLAGASGASGSAPAAAAEALSRALASAVERGDAPGVVGLVVSRDGVLFEGAAGQHDVASGTPMTADAIFNIASMTKPVTSVAAMILVERGMLGLDDPVSSHLPGFDALQVLRSIDLTTGVFESAPAQNVMTVRHLLTHTSGIGYAFANSTVQRLLQDNPGPEWALPLLNEPGAEWHYSASTRVVGLIIEQLTGQDLEAFFQQEIFVPLGMNDTSYAVPAEKAARLPALSIRAADGSLQENPQNAPATPTPPFNGDGGLYSTAHDYGLFMRMLLNGGALGDARILSEASVAQMGQNQIGDIFVELQEAAIPTLTRPFPLGAGNDKFGLGFQLTGPGTGDGPQRSPGSMAWAGLFNTEFWIDPTQQVAATLLMQVLPFYDEGALRALREFEAAVYGDLVPALSP